MAIGGTTDLQKRNLNWMLKTLKKQQASPWLRNSKLIVLISMKGPRLTLVQGHIIGGMLNSGISNSPKNSDTVEKRGQKLMTAATNFILMQKEKWRPKPLALTGDEEAARHTNYI